MPAPKLTHLSETRFYQDMVKMGAAKMMLRLLAKQFGALSSEQEDQVRSLSDEQLDMLSDAMFDFEGLGDLERWLGENVCG
jgi:Domain of unknown function (DUF4351)